MKRLSVLSAVFTIIVLGSACLERPKRPGENDSTNSSDVKPSPSPSVSATPTPPAFGLAPQWCKSERRITLLATNDLHGAIEPTVKQGKKIGGLSFFHGVTNAIRTGIRDRFTDACAGTLLLDGGDQFQGTLLSNFSEGALFFDLMSEIGYDAVVPGNHDYDFGPLGWLYDQVEPGQTSSNPREVIEMLAARAKFPLLSANTYLKATLMDATTGKPASVNSVGCESDAIIDWSKAKRPAFLSPYKIKTVAGVRVAMIGLDNPETPKTTTVANVSDLCFREPVEEYLAIRKEIGDGADVFVLVTHQGDIYESTHLTQMVTAILDRDADAIDAVVAGHTHHINEKTVRGVPLIQSAANGERFGRIDLVVDMTKKKVDRAKTAFLAGALLSHQECDPKVTAFCSVSERSLKLSYETKEVKLSSEIEDRIREAKKDIAQMADRPLGVTDRLLNRDRYLESTLGNALVDGLREVAQSQIAFINTGGIRANLDAGPVTYSKLYQILPFNNRAVVLGPMGTRAIVSLLTRSMKTCGEFGALVASGLRVTFSKDCSQSQGGVDRHAKLLTVEVTATGEVIYDGRGQTPLIVEKSFQVATLDFLATGGSGYDAFKGHPVLRDLGIYREALADTLARNPHGRWKAEIDGRWKNVNE